MRVRIQDTNSELIPRKNMRQLDPREQRFVDEYLIDLDPKRAALAAGYAKTTAATKAFTWVSNSKVKKHVFGAIQKAKQERSKRTRIDADQVMYDLIAVRNMSIKDILNDDFTVKPLNHWPDIWLQTVSSVDVKETMDLNNGVPTVAILTKIKWPDKLKTLELLGRHVDIKAFTEQHRHAYELSDDTVKTLRDVMRGARRKEIKHG